MLNELQRSWIEIDRRALAHNAKTLRGILLPETQLLAVVKANAYGHGLLPTAETLAAHVDWFGVDDVDEGIELRTAGIRKPILVLGPTIPSRAEDLVAYDLRPLVSDQEILTPLCRAARKRQKGVSVHLKVDTGMHRQGVMLHQLRDFFDALVSVREILLEGIATHFADADNFLYDQPIADQLQRFSQALHLAHAYGYSGVIRHAAASASAIRFPETHFDLVRIGLALYGIRPVPPDVRLDVDLTPVLSFRCRISQIKTIEKDAAIGYGFTERVKRKSRIAVLPIGYADGYDRKLSSRGRILVHGCFAKVLSRISMNLTVIDVTDIPQTRAGDIATVIGRDGENEITAWDIASVLETIPYEVLVRLHPRLPRRVIT